VWSAEAGRKSAPHAVQAMFAAFVKVVRHCRKY